MVGTTNVSVGVKSPVRSDPVPRDGRVGGVGGRESLQGGRKGDGVGRGRGVPRDPHDWGRSEGGTE